MKQDVNGSKKLQLTVRKPEDSIFYSSINVRLYDDKMNLEAGFFLI